MSNPLQLPSRHVHLVPITPGENLPSWLLRIAARNAPNFRRFSSTWFSDEMRVTPGFDAFPAASLLMQLGAFHPDQLDHYITHHTLLGTTKCFYTENEWERLINTHGKEGTRLYALRQKVKPEAWHLCPSCRTEEAAHGQITWPRDPQIPGMFYCSKHAVPVRLVRYTATRIPPLAAPAEGDLLPGQEGPAAACIGREEDHLTLARDVADTLAAGLGCLKPNQTLRDALALPLFGTRWSDQIKIWPTLVKRFGEPFLDAVEVRSYHQKQIRSARLHPSFHGIVYLALLARAYGTNLGDLFASVYPST